MFLSVCAALITISDVICVALS